MGLNTVADKKVNALSQGVKRILTMAIALCGDIKILVLDEPTENLDVQARNNMWDLILKTKQSRSITILLATQNIEEASYLSDYIYILKEGRIITEGTTNDIITKQGYKYIIRLTIEKLDQEFIELLTPIMLSHFGEEYMVFY